jgi:hypothetical protein
MTSSYKREVTALVLAFSVSISFSQLPPGRGRVMQTLRGQGVEVISMSIDDLVNGETTTPAKYVAKGPKADITIGTLYAKPY